MKRLYKRAIDTFATIGEFFTAPLADAFKRFVDRDDLATQMRALGMSNEDMRGVRDLVAVGIDGHTMSVLAHLIATDHITQDQLTKEHQQ